MNDALWITLIGMSLVFAAILLLWGLMALLVRLTAEKPVAPKPGNTQVLAAPEEPAPPPPAYDQRKRRAAAAAVATALARKTTQALPAAQPGATVSAWQTIQRANQMQQSAKIFRKKAAR